jgi:hypothetical protein
MQVEQDHTAWYAYQKITRDTPESSLKYKMLKPFTYNGAKWQFFAWPKWAELSGTSFKTCSISWYVCKENEKEDWAVQCVLPTVHDALDFVYGQE